MIPIIMVFMYPMVMLAVALTRLGIYVAIVVIAFAIRATIILVAEAVVLVRRWRYRRRWSTVSQTDSWRGQAETLRHKLAWRYGGVIWKLRAPARWWHARRWNWPRRAVSGDAPHVSNRRPSGK